MATEARKVATCKNFEAVVIQTDVTNKESVRCMVETAVRAFGRIDYASNIAGVNSYIVCCFKLREINQLLTAGT